MGMKRITVATYAKLRKIRGRWFQRLHGAKVRKTAPEWDHIYRQITREKANG